VQKDGRRTAHGTLYPLDEILWVTNASAPTWRRTAGLQALGYNRAAIIGAVQPLFVAWGTDFPARLNSTFTPI